MKLKTERDPSYIDPRIVDFFQNNGTRSISVILLTNRQKDGWKEGRTDRQINGREFNTSLAEVKMVFTKINSTKVRNNFSWASLSEDHFK